MILHPYHDAGGRLYPELDEREVGVQTLAAYEGVSRYTINLRTAANRYGRGKQCGVWVNKSHDKARGILRFRPALIWRRMGLGRYASQDGFDARQLEGRVTIFTCDPAATAARQVQAPAAGQELSPDLTKALAALAGMGLEALSVIRRTLPDSAQPIQFPMGVVREQ